jgi:peptidoglycan/LPS O-acetylase OafA/YrhL
MQINLSYKKGHMGSLDGVRGIAILLVLCFHCLEQITRFPINIISEIGWVGVDLFFVLSGFLITGILFDSKSNHNYFTSFYARRALRIFPLYYLCLFLIILILNIPNINSIYPALDPRHLSGIAYYLTFTQNIYFSYFGWGVTDLLNHFWSLAIEEQFYMFWPVVIYYLNSKKIVVICFLLIITSLLVRNYNSDSDYSYVFTLARVDALGIGALMAILIRQRIEFLNKLLLPFFITISLSLIIIIYLSPNLTFRNPYFVRGGYTLFALFFACIIAFIFDTKALGTFTNRILSNGILTFFGKYSYGLYIYHWILYKTVYSHLVIKYSLPKLAIIPFLIFVIILSLISYHCFEKFFLNFKTKFTLGSTKK